MSSPVTAEESASIVEAIRGGMSRNEAARTFERSPSTISRIAKAEGLEFDRAQTKAATKAKQIDNRARRAELAPVFLEKAEKALKEIDDALGRMHGETLVYNFGGRDNTYEEHVLDQPPDETLKAMAATVRDLMQTAKNAQSAVLDAERVDRPDASGGVLEGIVDHLAALRRDRG